jgi:acetolactate synthase-1/2/3 large subunit
MCELSTAVVHGLDVKVLILNNNYLGMVRQWQEAFYDNRLSGVDLEGNPDFVKLAEAYGVPGLRIRRPGDIDRKLREARAHRGGPVVVVAEVVKEGNVFPWIPAGAPVSAMMIEPPRGVKLEKPSGST